MGIDTLLPKMPSRKQPETNLGIEALKSHWQGELPFISECDDWQTTLRAQKIVCQGAHSVDNAKTLAAVPVAAR